MCQAGIGVAPRRVRLRLRCDPRLVANGLVGEGIMGKTIRLRLAASNSAEGLVVDGEVYAPGVGRSLLAIGRTCRTQGVHFAWGGDGPRVAARCTNGIHPVVVARIRQGLPCTNMKRGSVIRSMMKNWNGNIGPADYEDWRNLLGLPLQRELEPRNSDAPDKGPDHEDIDQKPPPGLVPPERPPKLEENDVEEWADDPKPLAWGENTPMKSHGVLDAVRFH